MAKKPEKWRGSVFPRGRKLYMAVKVNGKWKQTPTPYYVGQEAKAEVFLARTRDRLLAGAEYVEEGPLTVKAFSVRWLKDRERTELDDDGHDETRLRKHILPHIGAMRIDEVRPRHMLDLVNAAKAKKLAARTIRNVYSVAQAMFRDALIADLIQTTPCILRRPHLPRVMDKSSEWRPTALYTPDEVLQLISDPLVPEDRQVVYGLMSLGMMRHGEAAGLRWRTYVPMKPLGRAIIATSYNKGRTKSGAERWMPVHRKLAALLAEWKLKGWARMFGRPPTGDDLVVPREPDRLGLGGTVRSKEYTWYRLRRDHDALKMRRRRGHDLRRTGISMAREGGAERDVLRLCTHAPPRDVMELYTTLGWEKLCDQVQAIKLSRARATG